MSAIYQILTDAQELVRDPAHHTKGAYARDRNGAPIGALHPMATCWCGTGAIMKCGGRGPFGGLSNELTNFLRGAPGIVHTNDDKGHTELMVLFDRMREKAKALEGVA